MKNNLHGGMLLPDYWENSREAIAVERNWGSAVRGSAPNTCEENRRKYIQQSNNNMKILAQFLPEKPMNELTAFELLAAVQASKYANGKVYAPRTVKGRLSLLRDIYGFAEDRGDASNDLHYINDAQLNWYLEGVVLPPGERKKHFCKLAEKSRTKLRSLTSRQQTALVRLILKHIEEDGRYLALAILLYTGMRPSECRGLNWYDLVPFAAHPERSMLVVDRQRDDRTDDLINRLKRPASYRKIGVHFELEEIIRRRKKFVEEHLADGKDIASYPMCCFKNDLERSCTRDQLSTFAARILLEMIRVPESTMTYCQVDMLAYEDGIEKSREDMSVSTYLLRHDFWTWMQAATELSAEEKRYFFGHSIYIDAVDQRPKFNNEDWLWKMLLKLDHIIKFLPLHESKLHGDLGMESPVAVANMGIYTLHIKPEVLRAGCRVRIGLEANEYDDPIVVKTLTPTRNMSASESMWLKTTMLPHDREESYCAQKNMDYDNWYMRRYTRSMGEARAKSAVDNELCMESDSTEKS